MRGWLFITGIVFSFRLFSQLIVQPVVWKAHTWVAGKAALCFQDCIYPDSLSRFPYYEGRVTGKAGEDMSPCLMEYSSEIFPSDSLAGIDNLNDLPSEYVFSYQIKNLNELTFRVLPLKRNPESGIVERITGFTVSLYCPSGQTWATSSVLRTGEWRKFKITRHGVYKLTYSQIVNELGLTDPASIRIFGYGAGMLPKNNAEPRPPDLSEIPLLFVEATPGVFKDGDYVLFYAEGPVKWTYDQKTGMFLHQLHQFSDAAYYFATTSHGKAKTIAVVQSSGVPNQTVTTFDDFDYHEEEIVKLCQAGSRWFGETFDSRLSYSFTHTFPNIYPSSPARLRLQLAWQSPATTFFSYEVNGTAIKNVVLPAAWNTEECFYQVVTDSVSFSPSSGSLTFTFTYNKTSSSMGRAVLDQYDINVRRDLRMQGGQMMFRDVQSVGEGNKSRFILSDVNSSVQVWDVSLINSPLKIEGTLNGSSYEFVFPTSSLRTFIAFYPSAAYTPVFLGKEGWVANQDLHGIDVPELLIVTHPLFMSQAERLASHRRNQGMKVAVVTPQQIYNEFSSGAPDVQAIRDFARCLKDKNPALFRYLLLFGDGSWDNRFVSPAGNSNYILTYQMEGGNYESESIPVADDFFALLGAQETADSGFMDVGVGRLPVSDTFQASAVVEKLIAYDSPQARESWHNQLCFVADDKEDNAFTFLRDADETATNASRKVPELNITKIYLDAYKQYINAAGQSCPDASLALQNAVSGGSLMLNFTGHGGPDGITNENLFSRDVINTWNNKNRLFVLFTGSCKVARFDYLSMLQNGNYAPYVTAGEYALLKEGGGAVAVISTNRNTYSSGNIRLNNALMECMVDREAVDPYAYRLGDIYRRAKNIASMKGYFGKDENTRNFILLGDPSMRLSVPLLNRVVTDSVNGKLPGADTLRALQEVCISGHVNNERGVVDNAFNGKVSITLFDKPQQRQTIDNHGFGTETFMSQEQVIIKGNTLARNGFFSFCFLMPKDINYFVGKGKISYYAAREDEEYNGYDTTVLIGGMKDTVIADVTGPIIRLFMNDTTFKNGGITDIDPVLLAFVSDPSGINATGAGIGHDIVAVLDGDNTQYYVLNAYYETAMGDYRQGVIRYPFYHLKPGKHILSLTVWDGVNNSAKAQIEFTVISEGQFIIRDVTCYPNPMTDHAYFVFEHNMPDEEMKVTLMIYDMSGVLIQQLTTFVMSEGYTTSPLLWDGRTAGGANTGNGVYLFRIIAEIPARGLSATATGRLIIAQ